MATVEELASECKFCPPGRGVVVQGICAVCAKWQSGYRFQGRKKRDPKTCGHKDVRWRPKRYVPGAGTYRQSGRCAGCGTTMEREVPE